MTFPNSPRTRSRPTTPSARRRGAGQGAHPEATGEDLYKLVSEAQTPITDAQNEAACNTPWAAVSGLPEAGHGSGRIPLAGQHRADRGLCGQGGLRLHHGTAYSMGEVDPEDAGSLSDRLAADPACRCRRS
jgi:hypothetical protein